MPVRGDRKSERRQDACRIQALFQLSQLQQPGSKRCLQLPLMKRQVVMKLRQMHSRADRLEDLPNRFQPSEAAASAIGIPWRPSRRDPRFPLGIAVDKRGGRNWNLFGHHTKLLTGQVAARMRTVLQQMA